MTTPAASVAPVTRPSAIGSPDCDQACRTAGADISGPVLLVEMQPRPAAPLRWELRSLILLSLHQRRADLTQRADRLRRETPRRHKALSICEAELRGVTNTIMMMETGR